MGMCLNELDVSVPTYSLFHLRLLIFLDVQYGMGGAKQKVGFTSVTVTQDNHN